MQSVEHIRLDMGVPRELQEDILKNLYWVDEGLRRLDFDPDDKGVLRYVYQGQTPADTVRERLGQMAGRLLRSLDAFPAKTIYENDQQHVPGCQDVDRQLRERRWIIPVAAGCYVYRGLMSNLYHALDRKCRHLAMAMGAQECKFPSMVDLRTLIRSGYLNDFAHNANFVCHLPEQFTAIRQIKARLDQSPKALIRAADCVDPERALSPTVCYHLYKSLEGRRLTTDMTKATAVSSCFRHEGKATAGLTRLCEFNMREIIGVGEPPAVSEMREALLDTMKELLEVCELHSRIETASDPFFLDVYEAKRMFQLSFDLKHEVRAYLPDEDRWIAIGSVNYHQDHFGKGFGISLTSGAPAHSCCLGFGLDRWSYAIFSQYGLDPVHWPLGVRRLIEEDRQ